MPRGSHIFKLICNVKQKFQELKAVIREMKRKETFYNYVSFVERISKFVGFLLLSLKQTSQSLLKLFGLLL